MTSRFGFLTVASAILVALSVDMSGRAAQVTSPPPSVVAPPTWSRAIRMPDGRSFVTDGGLMIDAAIAKPATMPSVVLPVENGKIMAARFDAPYDKEFGLGQLGTGSLKNTFITPSGLTLNGNYVNFLRRVLPVSGTKIRSKGPLDPLIVIVGSQPVAIMMPMASPK